jgi:hypothetical protein
MHVFSCRRGVARPGEGRPRIAVYASRVARGSPSLDACRPCTHALCAGGVGLGGRQHVGGAKQRAAQGRALRLHPELQVSCRAFGAGARASLHSPLLQKPRLPPALCSLPSAHLRRLLLEDDDAAEDVDTVCPLPAGVTRVQAVADFLDKMKWCGRKAACTCCGALVSAVTYQADACPWTRMPKLLYAAPENGVRHHRHSGKHRVVPHAAR